MTVDSPVVQQVAGDAVDSNVASHISAADVAEIGDDVDLQEGNSTSQHDLDVADFTSVSSDDDGTEYDSGQYQLGFDSTTSTSGRYSLRGDRGESVTASMACTFLCGQPWRSPWGQLRTQ